MRHRVHARKLGRTSAHRLAMYRNLVTSLLQYERVETTDAKAKEVRRLADRMITLGKRGDLHARRRALRVIRGREVAAKVFGELAERYRDRAGGYTRVLKARIRTGDAAPLSIVELVESAGTPEKTPKRSAAKKAPSKKEAGKTGKAKAAAEKPAAKKATAKKATTKKATTKKATTKKATAKKAGAKKASRKKSD